MRHYHLVWYPRKGPVRINFGYRSNSLGEAQEYAGKANALRDSNEEGYCEPLPCEHAECERRSDEEKRRELERVLRRHVRT